jgi:hypothetical protein
MAAMAGVVTRLAEVLGGSIKIAVTLLALRRPPGGPWDLVVHDVAVENAQGRFIHID